MRTVKAIKILPSVESEEDYEIIVDESFIPTWDNLRKTIGGYVRSIFIGNTPTNRVYAFFDEDAIPKQLPVSCSVGRFDLRGPIVLVCGNGGDRIESLDDETIAVMLMQ